MKWRHAEEWISLTTDTAEGFLLENEFQVHEAPNIITILGGGPQRYAHTNTHNTDYNLVNISDIQCRI